MKTFKYIIYFFCTISIFSCKKDSIIPTVTTTVLNESVSGIALIDSNFDGIGDTEIERTGNTARVYLGDIDLIQDILGELPDTLEAPYNEILWADAEHKGEYLIEGVPPMENKSLVLYVSAAIDNIYATDETPDGDDFEEEIGQTINISIEIDEHDDGNNFTVQLLGSASGLILEDTNEDGVGDVPASLHQLGLYERDDNGLPVEPILANTFTNENGFYQFPLMPLGEYVIKYEAIPGYISINGMDESPEAGEPNMNAEPFYIQMDVSDESVEDKDNNFVVITNFSASGYVLEDLDEDGVGDQAVLGIRLELYERDASGFPIGDMLSYTYTDETGIYRFENKPNGEYVIQYIGVSNYKILSSSDETPEAGEPLSSPDPIYIPLDINSDVYEDKNNNFILKEHVPIVSISGFTLLDDNNDTIGDEPVEDLRLELYHRNSEGVPMTPQVGEAYSDEDGYYEFKDVPAGEYVIYYIGDGIHGVIQGQDESPEAGEPTVNAALQFIQVDLTSDEDEDSDNNYILKID